MAIKASAPASDNVPACSAAATTDRVSAQLVSSQHPSACLQQWGPDPAGHARLQHAVQRVLHDLHSAGGVPVWQPDAVPAHAQCSRHLASKAKAAAKAVSRCCAYSNRVLDCRQLQQKTADAVHVETIKLKIRASYWLFASQDQIADSYEAGHGLCIGQQAKST